MPISNNENNHTDISGNTNNIGSGDKNNHTDISGNTNNIGSGDKNNDTDISGNTSNIHSGDKNNQTDISGNITYVSNIVDISGSTMPVVTVCDDSITIPVVSIATVLTSNTTIGDGYKIVEKQGIADDGSSVINTTFTSTDSSNNDVTINENLAQIVTTYNDEINNSQSSILLQQIQTYASEINCSDFHGKGTIDDYAELFKTAASIANESKQMELDIDIEGFTEFGQAADELSSLFESFTTKLQNVNIITDIGFLTSISTALGKIVNLSKIFGKFKETILSTTTIEVPKSTADTATIIQGVMDEVNCAMNYINNFVSPTDSLPEAELSSTEKNIIAQAINTIDTWNNLCEQGVSIAMSNNTNVQYIQQASSKLKNNSIKLKSVTSKLKSKFVSMNIEC